MWRYRTPRLYNITSQGLLKSKNVEEGEIVMATLNGLPRPCDSFLQGICARRRLISFSRLGEECAQEESRLVTREEKMGAIEDQALPVHTMEKFKS